MVFGKTSRRLVEYWLSLWDGDRLPDWHAFRMTAVADLEPGISVFELHPEDVLLCIACGEAVARSIGMDIAGKDWLALAEPGHRERRLNGFRAIAAGKAGHCIRYAQHRSGELHYVEEILLPFVASADGVHTVLSYLGWRPIGEDAGTAEFRNSRQIPDEVILISLAPEPHIG